MIYNDAFFDQLQDRRGSGSMKWDSCHEKFGYTGETELLPMWIADMDFRSPAEVKEMMIRRAEFGSYGYNKKTDSFYQAMIDWVQRHYHWQIKKEWIVLSPGVIPGFHIAIQQLTEPGDGIIVQPPVYYPFMEGVTVNDRKLVYNPLIEKDGDWSIDFEDLETRAKDPANRMLIFCSPHNPVGRIWTAEELKKLVRICAENDVVLISDELHADLIRMDREFHAACEAVPDLKNHVITYYAPSKTFNLAGLQTAFAVIPDDGMRERYIHGLNANRIIHVNWFGASALETAYTQCDGYVEALRSYLDKNMETMKEFLDTRLPQLKMEIPQATYMTWVDFRGTGMSTEEIETFIIEKAHIAVDMGSWFGPGGAGYLRFNLACPRELVLEALRRLEEALTARV